MANKKHQTVKSIIDDLATRKKSISCCGKGGLLEILSGLGFSYKGGASENHKVFTHKYLTEASSGRFTTFSIDCGHMPKRPMKLPYVQNVIRILGSYENELNEFLNRQRES
ncbi:MAG: hypothetical protein CVV11_06700 [Gammaproteobacteria bacterium HGW-Gammaproteobacteria-15]|nr:MAG: hypothetical protein CVV11_06700 [Gammaproteobacteria bacterium HGW-Gammaproteobacteria-15]